MSERGSYRAVPRVKADLATLIPRFDTAFDALERGELDAFTAITRDVAHPQCSFHSAIGSVIGGAKYEGVDGISSWFGDLIATTSERRWLNRRYEIHGDRTVVFLADMHFTGAASGAPLTGEVGSVFEFEDGLCVRITSFMSHDEARGAANARGVESAFRVIAETGGDGLLERYDEFFDEEFVWHPALVGGLDGRAYRGRAEFAQYWHDFSDAFDQMDFGESQVEPLGANRVLAWGPLHVRGAGGGVPIEQEAAYVFELREGKIISGRTFFGRAEAEEFASA